MSDLSLTFDDLDPGFHEDIRRLAARYVDMLNGSSEWPEHFYRAAVDGAYEGMLEAILDLTVETMAESAHDEWLNSLDRAA